MCQSSDRLVVEGLIQVKYGSDELTVLKRFHTLGQACGMLSGTRGFPQFQETLHDRYSQQWFWQICARF